MSKHKNKKTEDQQVSEEKVQETLNTAEEMNNIEQEETSTEETPEKEETNLDENTQKIEELERQNAELKDSYLRLMAEFDNFRKRTSKEKMELALNGGEKVLTSLLPVLDDLERAQRNIAEAKDIDALREGVELVFNKLTTTLENNGLKKIDTENQDFNTDFHEAIAMIPAPNDEAKGKVIDCVQAGYMLNDKVIRHAKVAIGQ